VSRTLHLLVTSERPDAYLNSVVHCLLYEEVREVEFLHIQGFGEDSPSRRPVAGMRSANVSRYTQLLLEDLAETGEYRYFAGEHSGEKVPLRQEYPLDQFTAMQEIYRYCLQLKVHWDHRDIAYTNLRNEIAAIVSKKSDPIIDVSAVSKTFIGDLVAAGVVEGLSALHTFDLIKHADYDHPWTMLFHELRPNGSSPAKYKYINLLDTRVFRECSKSLLVKKPSTLASLILSAILLVSLLIIFWVWGPSNAIIQMAALLSGIASILSLYFIFYPPRR
jgi:hypothetical protein